MNPERKILLLRKHKEFFSQAAEEGYKEYKTSSYIKKILQDIGYNVNTNIAKTGILAILNEQIGKECILFRADMDAIKSRNGEYKHLCGHDAHMSILLTVAEEVFEYRNKINGNIVFLFQPAEELSDGAKKIIEEGWLEKLSITKVFGLHMWSELKPNMIALTSGELMASGGQFQIEVIGKSAHSAMPNKGSDAIVVGCQLVDFFQSIVSRKISPLDAVVITVGTINGGTCDNILASSLKMTGTIRYFNSQTKKVVISTMCNMMKSLEMVYDCEIKFNYCEHVPPLINDCVISENLQDILKQKFDVITNYKTTCVDDFAYYLTKIPGAYILLGCQDEEYYPQHHENYYVTEKSMENGVDLLSSIIKYYLYGGKEEW